MSTGMSTLAETAHAVSRRSRAGDQQLALLHCVSAYPVPEGSENLRAIQTLARVFGTPVGLSDHARDSFCGADRRHAGRVDLRAPSHAARRRRRRRALCRARPSRLADIVADRSPHAGGARPRRRECLPTEAVNLTASRRALHATRAPGGRRRHRGGRHRGAAAGARAAADLKTRARRHDA